MSTYADDLANEFERQRPEYVSFTSSVCQLLSLLIKNAGLDIDDVPAGLFGNLSKAPDLV